MVVIRILCWAFIFIIKLRFPPGLSLADVLNKLSNPLSQTTTTKTFVGGGPQQVLTCFI